MQLTWHSYKYYPYEKDLALREVDTLLGPQHVRLVGGSVHVDSATSPELAERLVYFAEISSGGRSSATKQSLLERVNGNGTKRQPTRYSAHGLHEYKGKFNPQVAKALLNIFGTDSGQRALDPFCGSGTSLVECAHLGVESVGTDINPLAVFLANAKLKALATPAHALVADAMSALATARKSRVSPKLNDERGEYLSSWFSPEYLVDIERLKGAIEASGSDGTDVLLSLASNLLRDYSLQEPDDLRIRRRKSPYPDRSFFDAYEKAVRAFSNKLEDSQAIIGVRSHSSKAIRWDCKSTLEHPDLQRNSFDVALTSPPYATALPYIDTQRLSLVWLGLLPASNIMSLEAELVGSREIRGQRKSVLLEALDNNSANLPAVQIAFCRQLQAAIGEGDGFRRQVVPRLLYRYFQGMSEAFTSVRQLMKPGAKFGLIVGGNHTILGGQRFDIDTPTHLAGLACENGWAHVETVGLQTYQRFGLHANNATSTEAFLILQAN